MNTSLWNCEVLFIGLAIQKCDPILQNESEIAQAAFMYNRPLNIVNHNKMSMNFTP